MDTPFYRLLIELCPEGLSFTYSGPEGPSRDFSHPFDKKAVSEKADRVFSCLTPSKTDFLQEDLEDAAGLLTDAILVSDLNSRLKKAGLGSYLVLELTPELAWIPWELTWDGEQFLCQRFCVARQLLKTRRELDRAGSRLVEIRSGRGVLLAFGDTRGLPAIEEKQAIEKELTNFRVEYHGRLTADDLLKKLKRDYDILHFVGHGEYVEGEGGQASTGWRCIDRTLTRANIESVSNAVFPFLIFANACDSARTSIRFSEAFVTDLYQAFLSKGVPQYIGTINRVPAEASINLARVFYHELAGGETIGRSLWKARQRFFDRPGSPIWAYYVHYGYPSSRLVLERPIVRSPKEPRQILQEKALVEPWQSWQKIPAPVASSLPPPVDKSSPDDREHSARLYDKAFRLFKAEVFDEALKVIHQAARLSPKDEIYYWLEGQILLKLEKVSEAVSVLAHAVDLDPEIHVSHVFLAQALEEAGRLQEALGSYDKAYLVGVGHLTSKSEQKHVIVRDAARTGPALRQPHYYQGLVKSKEDLENLIRGACIRIYPHLSEDELEAEFERVRKEYRKRPHDKRVQIKLWVAYVRHIMNLEDQGAIDDAIDRAKEFSEIAACLDAGVSSIASHFLGDLYCKKGFTVEALAFYKKALSEQGTPFGNIKIHSDMASLLVGCGAFADAEAAIQAALEVFHTLRREEVTEQIRTEVARLYWHWAECRLAAKDYDNALKYNSKTVEFDPSSEAEQIARRFVILWDKGDSKRAEEEVSDFPQSKKDAILEVFKKWGIPSVGGESS